MVTQVGNMFGNPTAGRKWYKTASKTFIAFGATQSEYAPCLFYMIRGNEMLIALLYVNDIITAHTRSSFLRDELAKDSRPTSAGPTSAPIFRNLSESACVSQSSGVIRLDSERYITKLANEVFSGGIHANYAMPARPELPSLIDDAVRRKGNGSNMMSLDRQTRYRRIVGGMLCIAMSTRLDVSYAVGMLTCCLSFPTDELLKEAKRVLIYLYNTRTLAIAYRSSMGGTPVRCNSAPILGPVTDGDSDMSFEAGRSTSGYSFRLSDAAIAWGMKKQQSVALITCEAEIMAGSLAALEAVHLCGLLTELGFLPPGPTELHMDNSSAISLAHDPVSHARSKHIHCRELKILELVADSTIKP
eukprot:1290681-Pleurochrysis_carterae.AAC.1